MKKTNVLLSVVLASVTAASLLTACGSKTTTANTETNQQDTAATEATGEVKVIQVGSGSINPPYCYLDDAGNPTGFEYALLDEIQKELPQYKFEYNVLDFPDVLTSLAANKIDLAAWQFEKNEEREKKFIFTNESYSDQNTYFAVRKDNPAQTVAELHDIKVDASTTQSIAYNIAVDYANAHPEQNLEVITSGNSGDEAAFESIRNGSVGALVHTEIDTKQQNERFGEDLLRLCGDPLTESQAYYVLNKDETQLRDDLDAALKTLKENGKLEELKEKWLYKYIPEE